MGTEDNDLDFDLLLENQDIDKLDNASSIGSIIESVSMESNNLGLS